MNIKELITQADLWVVKSVSEAEFAEVVEKAKLLNALGNEQRLLLYGLYKQATIGDVNVASPWSIDVVGKAKWYVS